MKKINWAVTAIASASLATACGGGGGASQADYDSVREAFDSTLTEYSGQDVTVDISDSEIDCVAKAFDVPVSDLDDTLIEENDSSEEDISAIFRCLDSDSARSLFSAFLGSDEDAAAAGFDKGCVVDSIMTSFDEWKANDGDSAGLQTAVQGALANEACATQG